MKRCPSLAAIGLAVVLAPAALAHSKVSAIAVNPNDIDEVWVANRDNDSVSVIDVSTATIVAEIPVGVMPRSLAFNAAGTEVFVANQRGNIPRDRNYLTPFLADGTERRGLVSVIDVASKTVTDSIDLFDVGLPTERTVGTETFGVVVAPNGEYMAISGFRSGTVVFVDTTAPYDELARFEFDWNLNELPPGSTVLTADEDDDFIADTSEPRFMTIQDGSSRVFVSHNRSPWVSVLDLTLDGGGEPTAVTLTKKIGLDDYAFDQLVFDNTPHPNPSITDRGGSPVQTIQSQGRPRFLGDVALSPDGTRALVPHMLANVNHDVNHSFPGLAGDFANRLYPGLTMIDATSLSYNQGGDASRRLHHELSESTDPAAYIPYGGQGWRNSFGVVTLGGDSVVKIDGTGSLELVLTGQGPLDLPVLFVGITENNVPLPGQGTFLCNIFQLYAMFSGTFSLAVPDDPSLEGQEICMQVGSFREADGFMTADYSNGIRIRGSVENYGDFGENKMGHRAGHPAHVLWHGNDHALMLNRGSEDLFLYKVQGSDMRLRTVFPPRNQFVERAALDTTTPMGDLPLGMCAVDDPTTTNDDSLVYVANELTRTISVLRVDWVTGVITKEHDQISTISGPDKKTASQILGLEIFEDASRDQTTGRFNNSCGSCHFEGGADGIVWQRPAGPRSTMPMYGGTLATGRLLWKSVRLNNGETGPMFGGENGGHGIFDDTEQQALIDVHEDFPIPLNPNLDQITGDLTDQAKLGQDLFFGTNDTGLNPDLRAAGCAVCHPKENLNDMFGEFDRGFTADHIPSVLVNDPSGLQTFDSNCNSLAENLIADGFRNVNSGVNIDSDDDMVPDPDRNDDGINDLESYLPQNPDADDPFGRDDPNSYDCGGSSFQRQEKAFSIPTKLGVYSTGPYMHDHVVPSLRAVLDPALHVDQSTIFDYDNDGIPGNDVHPLYAQYSDPSYPLANKFVNEFHDIRGNNLFAPGGNPNPSKVQLDLRSSVQAVNDGRTLTEQLDLDIEAILAYIQSI